MRSLNKNADEVCWWEATLDGGHQRTKDSDGSWRPSFSQRSGRVGDAGWVRQYGGGV